AVLEELDDRALHVDVDALVDAVVLEGADHFEAGAIADVREPRVSMAAEVPLQDAPVLGPIEHGAPLLELANPVGRFLRVEFRHPPVVDVLAAAHRVREVDLPAVAIVDVGERGRDAPLRHHGVRFSEERLAHEADGDAGRGRFDCSPQACAARTDHQNVVFECLIFGHHRILKSDHTPIEHSRTYTSEKPTTTRLIQANSMCLVLSDDTQLYTPPRAAVWDTQSLHPPTRCRSEWQLNV